MPIKVTDFDWSQKELSIFINLGLKNSSPKNVDIVCTSSYLKVNFNPYIFEIFFRHKIEPDKTTSIIKKGSLHFHLTKTLNQVWDSLETCPQNKEEVQELRTAALKEYEENEKTKANKQKEQKIYLERLAVSKQISYNEEKQTQQKELIKQEEVKFFKESVNSESSSKMDRLRHSSLCSEDGSVVVSEGDYDGDEESATFSSCENLPGILKNQPKSTDDSSKRKSPRPSSSIPSVRQSHVIKTRHTAHAPALPKRQSVTGSSSPEEEQRGGKESPESQVNNAEQRENLKAEATNWFNCGDFAGAVKAYTALIALRPSQASYYSNRAAAFLALDLLVEAVNDCSKALRLLRPASKENSKSRLLCHVRRGTAHVRLKDLSAGLSDFEVASRLDPNNVSLAKDAAVIRTSLNAYTDTAEDSVEDESSSSEEEGEGEEEAEKSEGLPTEESQSDFSSSSS